MDYKAWRTRAGTDRSTRLRTSSFILPPDHHPRKRRNHICPDHHRRKRRNIICFLGAPVYRHLFAQYADYCTMLQYDAADILQFTWNIWHTYIPIFHSYADRGTMLQIRRTHFTDYLVYMAYIYTALPLSRTGHSASQDTATTLQGNSDSLIIHALITLQGTIYMRLQHDTLIVVVDK